MIVVEISRSADDTLRTLLSDERKTLIGVRQQFWRGRPIVELHTALAWADHLTGGCPRDLSAAIEEAIKAIHNAMQLLGPQANRNREWNSAERRQLIELAIARDRLAAIHAPHTARADGKWQAITEANEKKRAEQRQARLATQNHPAKGGGNA